MFTIIPNWLFSIFLTIACLLSGGLDSSLVSAIASKHIRDNGQKFDAIIKPFKLAVPFSVN